MTDTSGTPIPVPDNFPCSWPDPQDATLTWHRETMHCPEALPALASDFWQTVWQGLGQSFRHYGEPHQPLLRWINNYIYVSWSLTVKPDEKEAAEKRARQAQEADAANLQPLWEDEFLPEIQNYLDCWDRFDLAGAPPDQFQRHVGKTWDWLSRIWILHFRLPNWQGRTLFIDYCKELFGEEEPNPAQRLTQGLPTKTTDMGRALWALSQRIPPAMSAVIASGATAEIRGALDDFLAAYGHRGNHWGLQYPTWIEDPSPVFAALRGYLADPAADPQTPFAAQATEREEALAAVRTRLQGYPQTARDRFEELLALAQVAEMLRENHNFWIDFSCTSRVRRAMLAAGRRLAAADALESADDIMHLHLEEVRAALEKPSDQRALVDRRRAELEKFSAIEPPPRLGVEPPPEPEKEKPDEPPPPDEPGLLRGQAAAPGRAKGPARIVKSVAGATALAPGEILVAGATAPSHTPLFAIAGGIVTETGGALGHSVVVAREYRIPAVVLADARDQIADGQWLEIDGDAGTVRLIDP